jgi:hypothetical protein
MISFIPSDGYNIHGTLMEEEPFRRCNADILAMTSERPPMEWRGTGYYGLTTVARLSYG